MSKGSTSADGETISIRKRDLESLLDGLERRIDRESELDQLLLFGTELLKEKVTSIVPAIPDLQEVNDLIQSMMSWVSESGKIRKDVRSGIQWLRL